MASRPVFVPDTDPDHPKLVHEHEVDFQWQSDRSQKQKKANIAKLHAAAVHRNLVPLLEVTPESDDPLGANICVSNLAVEDDRSYLLPLIAIYNGSKVFTEIDCLAREKPFVTRGHVPCMSRWRKRNSSLT